MQAATKQRSNKETGKKHFAIANPPTLERPPGHSVNG